MTRITIACDNCKNGEIYSAVTGRYSDCNVCEGTGEITPCDQFSAGNQVVVFRNSRCMCGARNNDHQEA